MKPVRLLPLLAILLLPATAIAQDRIVSSDLSLLPKPVRETRAAMLDAARNADLAALQQIVDAQGKPIQLGFGGAETVADFAMAASLSGDGLDSLADLIDLLEAPFAQVYDGEGGSFYIWPYLAGGELTNLTDTDKVVAYQLVTPDALDDFIDYGGWLSFRTIIDDDGTWTAWVAGD